MRNESRGELKARCRQLSYTVGDSFVTEADLNALADQHTCEVYDRIVDAGPPERYAASVTPTSTAGQAQVPLEVDFRSLLDVYIVTNGIRTNVLPMRTGTRSNYRPPETALSLEIEYIPACPRYEDDGDTFDGVSGWGELIANLMARDVMIGREADPSVVMANIARLEARIQSRARSFDKGYPKRSTDLDEQRNDWWFLESGGPRRRVYRLRGSNIEIFESLGAYP